MNALGWFKRSAIHAESGRDAEAVRCADRALVLAAWLTAARFNRGICLLRLGRWQEGWRGYECGIGLGCRAARRWPGRLSGLPGTEYDRNGMPC